MSDDTNQNDIQEALDQAIAKAEENLNGWKKAQADFENYRKRKEAEGAEWIEFGKQAAFVKLLPIFDSIEQALIHAPESSDQQVANWVSGLKAVMTQINKALQEIGIEKIEAVGKKFDPNLHEAIKEIPGEEDGVVAEQFQTGFTLKGKVLRPAQVVITKKQ